MVSFLPLLPNPQEAIAIKQHHCSVLQVADKCKTKCDLHLKHSLFTIIRKCSNWTPQQHHFYNHKEGRSSRHCASYIKLAKCTFIQKVTSSRVTSSNKVLSANTNQVVHVQQCSNMHQLNMLDKQISTTFICITNHAHLGQQTIYVTW